MTLYCYIQGMEGEVTLVSWLGSLLLAASSLEVKYFVEVVAFVSWAAMYCTEVLVVRWLE